MEKITQARREKIARLVVIFVVVACWLFLALPAQATGIGFVKNIGTNQSKTAGTSISVTVPAAGVKAGNSIIVTFAMDSTSGSVSVSDTAGNTYNLDADTGVYVTYVRTLIFSAHNVTALVSGNTITVTHPSVNARAVSANEFSGLAKTSALALDKTSTATGDSTTPSSGSTATTTQADELLIGAIGVEGPLGDTFTAGSGYTALPRDGTTGASASSNITINPEYRIVSATGTYVADGTLSDARKWAAAIATYKMLTWQSYQDANHVTQCDSFSEYATQHTVYMYGQGFAPSTAYRVIFWDQVNSTWYNRDTVDVTSTAGGELGVAGTNPVAHTFVPGTDTDGTWHCTTYDDQSYSPSTYDPSDSKLVADDTSYTGGFAFYVAPSAIPEFPTVLATIAVAGLCFGIYWWMRRKLAYVKA